MFGQCSRQARRGPFASESAKAQEETALNILRICLALLSNIVALLLIATLKAKWKSSVMLETIVRTNIRHF